VAAGLTLLTRLPFLARYLWDHDSVQLALAVERFDLAAHQPHPPGYPLYIALLKVLGMLGVGSLAAMNALSVLAVAAGAAALVPLMVRLSGLRAAALAVALYVFNPLLWFYGELPLVYAVEGGMAVVVAWAVVAMPEGRSRFLLAWGLLALAGGLRPSSLVLLSPLLLWGVLVTWRRGRLTVGRLAGGGAVGAAVVLAWLLPLLAAAGGLAAYREISSSHFDALLPRTSVLYGAGWSALAHNVFLVAKWAAQGWVPCAAVLALLWMLSPRAIPAAFRLLGSRSGLLAAWALPPMLFFSLFHITKAGYTLIYLPALLVAGALLSAPALTGGAESRPTRAPGAVRTVAAAVLAATVGGAIFLLGRDREPDAPRWQALVRHELCLQEIRGYERDLEETLSVLRAFPPGSTVFATVELSGQGAAGSEGFLYPWHRHLQWYLPGAPIVYLVPEIQRAELAPGDHRPFQPVPWGAWVPETAERIVWVLAGPPDERFELPPGETISTDDRFWVVQTSTTAGVGGTRPLDQSILLR